jgi:hypothetical protein
LACPGSFDPNYLHDERTYGVATDRVFLALKGQRRGQPLSAQGLDEIVAGAAATVGLGRQPRRLSVS